MGTVDSFQTSFSGSSGSSVGTVRMSVPRGEAAGSAAMTKHSVEQGSISKTRFFSWASLSPWARLECW